MQKARDRRPLTSLCELGRPYGFVCSRLVADILVGAGAHDSPSICALLRCFIRGLRREQAPALQKAASLCLIAKAAFALFVF